MFPTAKRIVVTGLAGSGKTYWVESQRQPGDMVFDLDALAATLFKMPTYPRPDHVLAVLLLLQNYLANILTDHPTVAAYFIVADAHRAGILANRLCASVKTITCDEAERERRLSLRG